MGRFARTFGAAIEAAIQRRDSNRAALARACGLAPSTIGDLINGKIAVSEKNLARILHGFPDARDQVELLLAYLRGQVPSSLRGAVTIEAADTQWLLSEAPAAADPLAALPPKLRDEVASIARRMAEDAQLRDLFGRTVRYLDGEDERVFRRANAGLGLRPPASPVLAPEALPRTAPEAGNPAKKAVSRELAAHDASGAGKSPGNARPKS
jgi:transcriptional regulator with XRE-family HTH domain